MGAAAAVILMKERQIVDRFSAARATTPEAAQRLDTLGIHDGVAVARLRDRAVLREAGPGRFYVDLEVWRALRRWRRRLAIIAIALVLLALAARALRSILPH